MNDDAPIILEYHPQCVEPTKPHEFVQLSNSFIRCNNCSLVISGLEGLKISEIINKKIGSLHAT